MTTVTERAAENRISCRDFLGNIRVYPFPPLLLLLPLLSLLPGRGHLSGPQAHLAPPQGAGAGVGAGAGRRHRSRPEGRAEPRQLPPLPAAAGPGPSDRAGERSPLQPRRQPLPPAGRAATSPARPGLPGLIAALRD